MGHSVRRHIRRIGLCSVIHTTYMSVSAGHLPDVCGPPDTEWCPSGGFTRVVLGREPSFLLFPHSTRTNSSWRVECRASRCTMCAYEPLLYAALSVSTRHVHRTRRSTGQNENNNNNNNNKIKDQENDTTHHEWHTWKLPAAPCTRTMRKSTPSSLLHISTGCVPEVPCHNQRSFTPLLGDAAVLVALAATCCAISRCSFLYRFHRHRFCTLLQACQGR